MAFDFMDLFPDSPAAVAGSQGARDILENQYKQAMGALEMENALIRSVAAKQAFDKQQREAPIQDLLDRVKVVQAVNTPGAHFDGLDLSDDTAFYDRVKSAPIKTNFEVDMLKTQGAKELEMRKFQLGLAEKDDNMGMRLSAQERENKEKMAFAVLKKYIDGKGRIPPGAKQREQMRLHLGGILSEYGDTRLGKSVARTYSALLDEGQPQAAAQSQAPAAQEKKPMVITSKSGKKYELSKEGLKRL